MKVLSLEQALRSQSRVGFEYQIAENCVLDHVHLVAIGAEVQAELQKSDGNICQSPKHPHGWNIFEKKMIGMHKANS